MAVALAEYAPQARDNQSTFALSRNFSEHVSEVSQYAHYYIASATLVPLGAHETSSTVEISSLNTVSRHGNIELKETTRDRNAEFEIAYHALADRRGANATPSGRITSRRIWIEAGPEAAQWLIERLKTEQHPEIIIGIAETLTAMGGRSLEVVLSMLERPHPETELQPIYGILAESLAWMTLPSDPLLTSRIVGIIGRYLVCPHLDCKLAAIQLTRLLDDENARMWIEVAKRNAGHRLNEEIDDVLNERFS